MNDIKLEKYPKVILVGTVRNCEKSFYREYTRLIKACKKLNVIDSFFVELDSNDKTSELLSRLSCTEANFHFETLGILQDKFPNRIERIRYCRNRYIHYVRENYVEDSFDYMIVADMDGINSAISKISFKSCFKVHGWDALFSNQLLGISDLLALRAERWIEKDYLIELESARIELRRTHDSNHFIPRVLKYFKYDLTRKKYIYDKMRCIGIGKKLIPVISAFGGIAIYKSWCIFCFDYSTEEDYQECEHVALNRKLYLHGANLFINPRFINSVVNTYNINKFFLIRNLRLWRWNYLKKE